MSKNIPIRLSLLSLVMVLLLVLGISQLAFAGTGDGDIARQFVTDSPTDGMYCTESANTLREYAPDKILTNGVVDPFFKNGGFMMGDTTKKKFKMYVICVDFEDLPGNERIPYGIKANVRSSDGMVYDYSRPETYVHTLFDGSWGFKNDPKYTWTGTRDYEGMTQLYKDISMGQMEMEVICLNQYVTDEDGNWQWFTLPGGEADYAIQYAAAVEDFRIFARLHQGAIDAAYREIPSLDIEDIDFLCTVVPMNTFGYRQGLQGGGGIDTAFSYQDQSIILRDTEYRREPGVTTKGGRVIGSAIFPSKGAWGYAGGVFGADAGAFRTMAHEFSHGLGQFDDYSYGGISVPGQTSGSGASFGVMSNMTNNQPDMFAWRKFRAGWLTDEEIVTVLPGESKTVVLRALGSYGQTGQAAIGQVDDGYAGPDDFARMVLIPKEWRTTDTFGVTFNNGWNPNKTEYNFFDWFTPVWLGGETHAMKSFPTAYTLESRKAVGADFRNTSNTGVLVTYIANSTWETGHGYGGFKQMANTPLRVGGNTSWADNAIGLTVTVLESNAFYDKITIDYTGVATGAMGAAKRVYQGELTLSDNYVTADQNFTVDFNLFTIGATPANDATTVPNNASAIVRLGTPLGVPGGVSGYTMTVSFDKDNLEYVGKSSPFSTCNVTDNGDGTLTVKASNAAMIRDNILSLQFKTKAAASVGDHNISAAITDVDLLTFRGTPAVFDGVGTAGSGNTVAYEEIRSKGGKIAVSTDPRYTLNGRIVVYTEGDLPGTFIGVESVVDLYDSTHTIIATVKSRNDGSYTIPNVPAGTGYYIIGSKHNYFPCQTEDFSVAGNTTVDELMLLRQRYTVSGHIFGSANSNGSGDKVPLAGAKVEVMDCGFFPLGPAVYTDDEGYYETTVNVEPNAYATLVATKEGYGNSRGPAYGINANDLFRITGDVSRDLTITETFNVYARIGPAGSGSSPITYTLQLRDAEGNAVGDPVSYNSVNNSGDITIPNVPPGHGYYIEATANNYIGLCSTHFDVLTDNVFMRNGNGSYTVTLPTVASGYTVTGQIVDDYTGEPLAAQIQFSNSNGVGVPISTNEDGTFSYRVMAGSNEITFSMPGYTSQTVSVTSATASGLEIDLKRDKLTVEFLGFDNMTPLITMYVENGAQIDLEAVPTIDKTVSKAITSWGYEVKEGDNTLILPFDLETIIEQDYRLVPWTGETRFKVSFMDGDTELDFQYLPEGGLAVQPEDPVKEGYTFLGWFLGEEEFDFETPITAPAVINAKFAANTYTVTFDYNGGVGTVETMDVIFGSTYGELPATTRDDHDFIGWSTNGMQSGVVTAESLVGIAEDHTLTAIWTKGLGNLQLTTEATQVKEGDQFSLHTFFLKPVKSNAAILDYAFNTDKFDFVEFIPADGVGLVLEEETETGMRITVMVTDYNTTNYGDLVLQAKKDAIMVDAEDEVTVTADYVKLLANGQKEVLREIASTIFDTIVVDPLKDWKEGEYTLIHLSNLIDIFGVTNAHAKWATIYLVFDFNANGEIDVNDIATFASKIIL